MDTMDESPRRLYESAQITYDAALSHARDPKMTNGDYKPATQQ